MSFRRDPQTTSRRLIVACAAPLAVACAATGPEDDSLNGLFYGTIEGLETERDIRFSRTVNLSLTEDLGALSGSFSIVGAYGSGTVSGTVTGSTVSFVFHQTYPCPGSFAGTATSVDGRLSGSYAGAGCRGYVTASFEVARTPPTMTLPL